MLENRQDASNLKKGLKQIAKGTAAVYGLGLGYTSRRLIYRMIDGGVNQLKKEGPIDAEVISKAQNDIILIISEMAKTTINERRNQFGEDIYVRAKRKLCPLPPWFPKPC